MPKADVERVTSRRVSSRLLMRTKDLAMESSHIAPTAAQDIADSSNTSDLNKGPSFEPQADTGAEEGEEEEEKKYYKGEDGEEESDEDDDGYAPEELIKAGHIRAKLRSILDNVKSAPQFAHHEERKNPPNPGLCINGHGNIGFPLSERDIEAIIAASGQDMNESNEHANHPRKIWKLNRKKFETKNPAWRSFVVSILTPLISILGVDSAGKGMRNKRELILQESGNDVWPTHEASDDPLTFGWLEIILPSSHEGGDLILRHGNQVKPFSTSKISEYDCSFSAWFSDVAVDRAPLTSGHQLIFRYSLMHSNPCEVDSATSIKNAISKPLRLLFSSWRRQRENVNHSFGYILDKEYADEQLCHQNCVGRDSFVVTQLQEICQETGFYVYLANVTKSIEAQNHGEHRSRYGFVDELEVLSETFSLDHLVDLDGFTPPQITEDCPFDEGDIIQDDPFPDCYDEDDEEGYFQQTFTRSMVIIMPQKYRMSFFLTGPNQEYDMLELLDKFCLEARTEVGNVIDLDTRNDMKQICAMAVKDCSWSPKETEFGTSLIPLVIEAIGHLDDKRLFDRAIPMIFSDLNVGTSRVIETMVQRHGGHWLERRLDNQFRDVFDFTCYYDMIQRIEKKHPDKTWGYRKYKLAVTTVELRSAQDAQRLLQLAASWSNEDLKVTLFQAVKRNVGNMAMTVAFLNGISNSVRCRKYLFETILSESIRHWKIEPYQPMASNSSAAADLTQQDRRSLNHYENLAAVLVHCHQWNFSTQLSQIVTILLSQVSKATSVDLEQVYLPFLAKLARHLSVSTDMLTSHTFQALYRNIVSSYVSKIPPKPLAPQNWTRKARGCGCNACITMDHFLESPDIQTTQFRRGLGERQHLEQRLRMDCHHRSIDILTIRSGSPHGLQVTKNRRLYEGYLNIWKIDTANALKAITALGVEPLKLLLGEHFYTIMDLRPIPPAATAALIPPKSAVPATQARLATLGTGNFSPNGRPSSTRVVDLTMDSSDEEDNRLSVCFQGASDPLVLYTSAVTNQPLPPPKRDNSMISGGGIENVSGSSGALQVQHKRARILNPIQAGSTQQAASSISPRQGSLNIVTTSGHS